MYFIHPLPQAVKLIILAFRLARVPPQFLMLFGRRLLDKGKDSSCEEHHLALVQIVFSSASDKSHRGFGVSSSQVPTDS